MTFTYARIPRLTTGAEWVSTDGKDAAAHGTTFTVNRPSALAVLTLGVDV